jgi:hypothetical protein
MNASPQTTGDDFPVVMLTSSDSVCLDCKTAATTIEADQAIGQREQGVVAADTHATTGVIPGSALADKDRSGGHKSAVRSLYAKALAVGIASVLYGALTFFMCHESPASTCKQISEANPIVNQG